MLQHSKSGLVPVLVDQFNDIIEWKAQVLQKEVESFEAQKVATAKVLPILAETRRYSDTDLDMFCPQLQKSYSITNINGNADIDMSDMTESAFPKLKRSKSQKCFTKKLNRVRIKAMKNTITEGTEMDMNGNENESVAERIARIKKEYQIVTPIPKVTFADEPMEIDVPPASPPPMTPPRVDHQQVIEDLAQLKLNSFKLSPEPEPLLERSQFSRSPSPVSKAEIEPENKAEMPVLPVKAMPTYNVLLEKLQNIYRHNFVVKTQVVDIGSRVAAALGKSVPAEGQCLCGEPFGFSDKTLQCILCLTKCHTTCASTAPTPCIKFVDPNLRPSKLISNYVYPRSRPSVPALLVNCCREIEAKCSAQVQAKSAGMKFSSLKLYYVESERLKLVQDECKKLLTQGKLGAQRMDSFTLDHLCGIVKYFLVDVCEPVFTVANWKEYSVNLHKKSEDELNSSLLDTFDAMPPSNVQTLCFMLLHLKHLSKCGYQDTSILVDIFCPILLGELEVRRKWRLMKVMFQMEDNVLLSFVER